jgi:predicted permease
VKYAVIYDQLGTFVPLATYGLFVVAYYGGGTKPTLRDALGRMLRFPPFIAFALAFTPLVRFECLQPLWSRLGDVLVPVAMFAVGLRLEWRPPRPRRVVLFGLTLKLLVMPLLAYGITRLLAAPPPIRDVAVLEAGMPASVTAGALAMQAGLAPELAAALVGYGVLLSMLTLPVISALLHRLT